MSYRIPFHRETFTPKTIAGNETADQPVTFELSMAAGPDQARLKSVLFAAGALAGYVDPDNTWSPQLQAGVIEAFRTGPQLFINCVGKIQQLTAPAALCRRVGITVDQKATDEDDVPITNGVLFAKVAPYLPTLALELAFEIQRLAVRGAIDPRFTAPPSGSPATAAATSGSAIGAPTTSDAGATAASPT